MSTSKIEGVSHIRTEGFRLELDEGVATITLDRPDRINALTFASYAALGLLGAALVVIPLWIVVARRPALTAT